MAKRDYAGQSRWTSGYLQQLPWKALFALVGVLLCMMFSTVVLIVSDQQVADWTLQPTVLIAVMTGLSNILLRYAVAEGAATHWWVKALEGTTVAKLHTNWSSFNSLLDALALLQSSTLIASASIVTTSVVIEGPLLQRATSITTSTKRSAVNLTLATSTMLPYTGYGVSVATPWFASVVRDYSNNANITIEAHGCQGACTASVPGAGLIPRCQTVQEEVNWWDDFDPAACVFGDNSSKPQHALFSTQFSLGLSGDSSGKSPQNYVYNVSWNVPVGSGYSSFMSCPSTLHTRNCVLQAAIVEYAVTLDQNTIRLVDPGQKPGILSTYSINEYTPGGNPEFMLGGVCHAANNLFGSTASIQYNGFWGWNTHFEGPLADQYATWTADQQDLYYGTCNLYFRDPSDDIFSALNELMFRASLAGPSGNSTTVSGTQVADRNIYQSRYAWLAAAVVVNFLSVLLVLPTFWKYWILGRPVTLSPVETGKAFGASVMHDVGTSNANAETVIRAIGKRRVSYGVVDGIAKPRPFSSTTGKLLDDKVESHEAHVATAVEANQPSGQGGSGHPLLAESDASTMTGKRLGSYGHSAEAIELDPLGRFSFEITQREQARDHLSSHEHQHLTEDAPTFPTLMFAEIDVHMPELPSDSQVLRDF